MIIFFFKGGAEEASIKVVSTMAEMEEALRSCMERLVIVREEREQIIVEAANEISAEKKKVRELQLKLEGANKKAAKLAAENNSLCKAADAKDAVIRELRESAAAEGGNILAVKSIGDRANGALKQVACSHTFR